MDMNNLRQIYLLGAEANENDLPFSEYKKDICLLIGKPWAVISLEQKQDIRAEFRKGEKDNEQLQASQLL